jgi:hypothetical protein
VVVGRRAATLAVVLVVLAGGIAIGAVADHRHKNARMGPANVASWYCGNRGQRCDEPQAEDVEAAWQKRERVYRISFWATSVGALVALGLVLRQRYVDRHPDAPIRRLSEEPINQRGDR